MVVIPHLLQIKYINFVDHCNNRGNAQDFGDLTVEAKPYPTGCCIQILVEFFGGMVHLAPYYVNTIDFVTIATTGNATDFGDLLDRTNGEFIRNVKSNSWSDYLLVVEQSIKYKIY